jgi:NAD(P)-dependent dehydrogenase (short-subunit alcohol dehydrogenase family)
MVFIVSGGTSGIGFEPVKMLYHLDASKTYTLGGSEEAERAEFDKICSSTPGPGTASRKKRAGITMEFMAVDLSDLLSIKQAA